MNPIKNTLLNSIPTSRLASARLVLAALCAGLVTTTDAQTAATPNPAPAASAEVLKLEAFSVSGSHIKGASTFTAPTPVLVIDQVALLAVAPINLAEGLKQLPAIAPGGGQTNGGGTGNSSANFLNLRALGVTRTLTLLDGRRFTPSGPTG